jgi:predicted deacylase
MTKIIQNPKSKIQNCITNHQSPIMLPAIETIPVRQMASGDILAIQVYKFSGSHPGKKVYIQSNLHGAEISGNAVIYQLI